MDPRSDRFRQITRRMNLIKPTRPCKACWIMEYGKNQPVVMDGKNTDDLLPLWVNQNQRFLSGSSKRMPFNGEGSHYTSLTWTYKKFWSTSAHFPTFKKYGSGKTLLHTITRFGIQRRHRYHRLASAAHFADRVIASADGTGCIWRNLPVR